MPDGVVAHNPRDEQQIPCRVCGETKEKSSYYPAQIRSDLSAGECKECTKSRVRSRSRENPKVQEYDRKRAKTPERKARAREITKRWRAENPAGYKAQSAVSNAVRDGRLSKEDCLFCGRSDVHAHHRDYTKPLDVIWLCPKCHHRLHKAFPETEAKGKGSSNDRL